MLDKNQNQMSKKKKLTPEEFEKLKGLSVRYQTIISEVGKLELKKASMMNTFPAVQGELFAYEDEIHAKYGKGKVNPQTGEIENVN